MRFRCVPIILTALGAATTGCASDGRYLPPPGADKTATISLPATSTTVAPPPSDLVGQEQPVLPFTVQTSWADGGQMNALYTCEGGDISPPITWFGAPPEAVEFALVVQDIDAGDFVHWIIAGLDPLDPTIPEGSVPAIAIQGANDFSTEAVTKVGWNGPCPPAGETHHYRFTLYALDQQTELPMATPAADLLTFIQNAATQAAQTTGVYTSTAVATTG